MIFQIFFNTLFVHQNDFRLLPDGGDGVFGQIPTEPDRKSLPEFVLIDLDEFDVNDVLFRAFPFFI